MFFHSKKNTIFRDAVSHFIFLNSPDAYFVLENSRIIDCNSAMEKMLLLTREQLLGLQPEQFSPEVQPDGRRSDEAVGELNAMIASQGYARFEWSIIRSDGVSLPVIVTVLPTCIQGRNVTVAFWQDIQALVAARDAETTARARDAARAGEQAFVVSQMAAALKNLASAKLQYRIEGEFPSEYNGLRTDFNTAVDQLSAVIVQLQGNVQHLLLASGEINAATEDLARRTERQAASIEETAAAVEEIAASVEGATARAEHAGKLVAAAHTNSAESGRIVNQAIEAIRKIEKSSSEISSITSVIDEIAFQTNLLALNAGVEAARAGDAGKGFAVVAQEVRELAQRSAAAAKEIRSLIHTSGSEVKIGVNLVEQTGSELQSIMDAVRDVRQTVDSMVISAREQAIAILEIKESIASIDRNTQQNAAMVEETAAAMSAIDTQIQQINETTAQFTLELPSHGALRLVS